MNLQPGRGLRPQSGRAQSAAGLRCGVLASGRDASAPGNLARLGFFELSKDGASPQQTRWRDFLTTGAAQSSDPEYLREAASIIEYVNLSSEERHMADLHEKFIADRDAALYWAEQNGIEQGLERNRFDNACAALRRGLSRDDIVAITGLDAATVDRLADEMGLVNV